MNRHTLAVIKPDAYLRRYEILDILFKHFYINRSTCTTWTKELAEEFYKEHKDKPFFAATVNNALSGPSMNLVLLSRKIDIVAIPTLRKLVGNTDPQKADEGTIRRLFGKKLPQNGIHASDSFPSFERETKLLFPDVSFDLTLEFF